METTAFTSYSVAEKEPEAVALNKVKVEIQAKKEPGDSIIFFYTSADDVLEDKQIKQMFAISNGIRDEDVKMVSSVLVGKYKVIYVLMTIEARNRILRRTDLFVIYCDQMLPGYDLLSERSASVILKLSTRSDGANEISGFLSEIMGYEERIFQEHVDNAYKFLNLFEIEEVNKDKDSSIRYSFTIRKQL